MNYIVEGMDRCGKTTLIDRLSEIMDLRVPIITTRFPKIQFENADHGIKYSKKLYDTMYAGLNYFRMINGQFIMDRSHLSEYVYGHIYRNYDSRYCLDCEKSADFCFLIPHLTLIVLIDTPENIQIRDDGKSNSVDHNDLAYERVVFTEVFNETKIKKKVLIDVDGKTLDDVFKIVKEHQIHQFNKMGDRY